MGDADLLQTWLALPIAREVGAEALYELLSGCGRYSGLVIPGGCVRLLDYFRPSPICLAKRYLFSEARTWRLLTATTMITP